ncbi:MAG: bifunctional adenosylcobinamide kinase/adenosylcobinamide-phosphate guanylyltransferase [Cellvibrionaceae bacterium]
MKHLILGGARSGKSRFAEEQALSLETRSKRKQLVYVATATAGDNEMSERIQHHQQRREEQSHKQQWQVIEEPLNLADVILRFQEADHCVLIDCLTLWITNGLLSKQWPARRQAFIEALQKSSATVLLVSNEVGSGVVPLGELSRDFVDESGRLHQELASLCDQVTLVVAGLPLSLKSCSTSPTP